MKELLNHTNFSISRRDKVLLMEKFVNRIISGDSICGIIDVVGSVSSAVGLVIGNIPATKYLTI